MFSTGLSPETGGILSAELLDMGSKTDSSSKAASTGYTRQYISISHDGVARRMFRTHWAVLECSVQNCPSQSNNTICSAPHDETMKFLQGAGSRLMNTRKMAGVWIGAGVEF